MPDLTYFPRRGQSDRPLVWLHGEIRTPPFSPAARIDGRVIFFAGCRGVSPWACPGLDRCHELRVTDQGTAWRIVHRVDEDAIVIVEVFAKKTPRTPRQVIASCRRRLRHYDHR